jgi:hypothetical protein
MVEVAQRYEMVRNFKAFVMFALKKLEALKKIFLHRQNLGRKFVRLGQNPRKCWSKHDDTPPPPPNVVGFATSLIVSMPWITAVHHALKERHTWRTTS